MTVESAYEATAAHFGITTSEVRRYHIREARKLGVHAVSEREIANASRKAEPKSPLLPIPEALSIHRVSSLVRAATGEELLRWNKYKPDEIDRLEALRAMVLDLAEAVPRPDLIATPPPAEDRLLTLYPLGDPHLGLRAADGTGLEDGADTLIAAVRDLVARGQRSSTAVIANLGDFVHSDDPSNKTRRSGHQLDVDGSWFEILKVARDVLLELVRAALEHHEHVHVKNLVGNHDDLTAVFLSLFLDAYFRDEPRVEIDTSAAQFQWYRFGQNLFGFTHGQRIQGNVLYRVMAEDRATDWAECPHRRWITGHTHQTRRYEIGGVVFESFRTLAKRDAYSEAAGYRSGKDLHRIVYDRDGGEVSREVVSPGMLV